jgi:hypothetical protein
MHGITTYKLIDLDSHISPLNTWPMQQIRSCIPVSPNFTFYIYFDKLGRTSLQNIECVYSFVQIQGPTEVSFDGNCDCNISGPSSDMYNPDRPHIRAWHAKLSPQGAEGNPPIFCRTSRLRHCLFVNGGNCKATELQGWISERSAFE